MNPSASFLYVFPETTPALNCPIRLLEGVAYELGYLGANGLYARLFGPATS